MNTNACRQITTEVANNLIGVMMNQYVKNPFLKASLTPFVETFVQGIANGICGKTMAQKVTGQLIPNSFDQQTGDALPGLTPQAEQTAKDLTQMYELAILQTQGEKKHVS